VSFFRIDMLPSGGLPIAVFGKPVLEYHMIFAISALMLLGAMAGYFVVPMNALLQHRGHVLMSAGHSIAVQNFNENIGVLAMLALYTTLIKYSVPVTTVMLLFGLFVAGSMLLMIRKHQANQREFDSVALIGVRH
jgi:hypothetical protein